MEALIGAGIFVLVYIFDTFRPSQDDVFNALGNNWCTIQDIKHHIKTNSDISQPNTFIINHHLENLDLNGHIEWRRVDTLSNKIVYRRRQPKSSHTSSLFS